MKKPTLVIGTLAGASALVFGTALGASATGGSGQVYVQDYIAGCDQPNRTTQFVLDALGADGPTTYTISDGTPAAVVTVAAHSTDRSPVFSIPASGASYTVSASTGQSWSFSAAADCTTPVTTDPEPTPVDPEPTPEPTQPVDPAPVDPTPAPEPETTPEPTAPPTTEPAKKSTVTVAWLMPEGSTTDEASYDQTFVSITDGDQLDAVAEAIVAEACGVYQVDVYHGHLADIDAVLADLTLTKGEDSALYVKHRFVEGTHCETTPPVVTPPVVTPPVVTPPTTPETPVVDVPVDETPVTDVPVDVVPVVDTTPVKVEAAKVEAAPVADGLAFTGTDDGIKYAGLAALLALLVGVPAVMAGRRQAQVNHGE